MTLEELLEINGRKFYRVMYCCSQSGPLYITREEAETSKALILSNLAEYYDNHNFGVHVEELDGWQEEITEHNAVDYIRAAMTIIKKLKEDLEISQELVSELLAQIVETEERYEQQN